MYVYIYIYTCQCIESTGHCSAHCSPFFEQKRLPEVPPSEQGVQGAKRQGGGAATNMVT